MKNSKSATYYIENLTVDSWVLSILPYFLKDRMRTLQEAEQIYYFNNSKPGLWLANFTLWFAKKQLKRVDFSQGGTRDQNGNLIWMKTIGDTLVIYDDIKNNSEFKKAVEGLGIVNSLDLFLGKWVVICDLMITDTCRLLKFIFFVRIIEHQEMLNDTIKTPKRNVFLFMRERPWFVEIAKFVKSKGIEIIPTGNLHLYFNVFLLKFDGLIISIKELCKKVAYNSMAIRYKLKERLPLNRSNKTRETNEVLKNDGKRLEKCGPRMAIEHYGYLNLDSPGMFSDLFFLQRSSLSAQDILIYFGLPVAPITDRDWSDIEKRGMSAVVINPRATTTPHVPLFNHKRKKILMGRIDGEAKGKREFFNHAWLKRYVTDYYRRRNYWVDFITQHNVKMHVTWFKYSPDHCAKLDALRNTGGVGVVYQRSFDYFLAPGMFTTADVVFGFSKMGAHVGHDQYSRISYYVVTGYLGDYRFGLAQKRANEVRNFIENNGAKKIVAYFDEHATEHPRWNLAYSVTLKNYSYLLNKVLENPWFGLILKPKVPSTLRSRLGPVSDLLRLAEKTGRCFVFEDGIVQGSYPPASASLGADIAVHGHLFAATAGVESALAGVPTLILDSEGVPESPLHNSGRGQIIFKDIESLWRTCMEHWSRPDGVPGFADWSDILDELDPFRDGRAAERMGTYLGWLMDGFKAGLPRETVLADAADRYGKIWGKEKILSVNVPSKKDFSKNHLIPIG